MDISHPPAFLISQTHMSPHSNGGVNWPPTRSEGYLHKILGNAVAGCVLVVGLLMMSSPVSTTSFQLLRPSTSSVSASASRLHTRPPFTLPDDDATSTWLADVVRGRAEETEEGYTYLGADNFHSHPQSVHVVFLAA